MKRERYLSDDYTSKESRIIKNYQIDYFTSGIICIFFSAQDDISEDIEVFQVSSDDSEFGFVVRNEGLMGSDLEQNFKTVSIQFEDENYLFTSNICDEQIFVYYIPFRLMEIKK